MIRKTVANCFFSNSIQAVPPLEITDLIEEVRDGHVLLSLLEVLLGTTLVSPFIIMFNDLSWEF